MTMHRGRRPLLNLALQGGGTHGAFTWGVLDRLLEDDGIDLGRISGASAGALNGAALVTGLARGGRQGAKEHLSLLWQKVAANGALLTALMLPLRKPGLGVWDDALPLLSPYQVNPLGMAPLRSVLAGVVDEAVLRDADAPARLFVHAVSVQTGVSRVFPPAQMSIEALLASACAPLSYPAVRIDGESYWDGSYAANPMLWPLHEEPDCDILMVELTPLRRAETPMSAKNILNRINEISSLNGLVAELRAIDTINRTVPGADIRMHVVGMPDRDGGALAAEPSIKRTVDGALFELLRRAGHQACDSWLRDNRAMLGRRSTLDVQGRYLAPFATSAGSAAQATTTQRFAQA